MSISLDKVLASHCAPVLLGHKPGALFTVSFSDAALRPYADILRPLGILFVTLGHQRSRAQMYVYRPALLQRALREPRVAKALSGLGYPQSGLSEQLAHLQARISASDEFPHEIGFFLGYPVEDVLGFMRHRGQSYKLSGPWKVYGDVERASTLFRRHDACTRYLLQKVEAGSPLCGECWRWHTARPVS